MNTMCSPTVTPFLWQTLKPGATPPQCLSLIMIRAGSFYNMSKKRIDQFLLHVMLQCIARQGDAGMK